MEFDIRTNFNNLSSRFTAQFCDSKFFSLCEPIFLLDALRRVPWEILLRFGNDGVVRWPVIICQSVYTLLSLFCQLRKRVLV